MIRPLRAGPRSRIDTREVITGPGTPVPLPTAPVEVESTHVPDPHGIGGLDDDFQAHQGNALRDVTLVTISGLLLAGLFLVFSLGLLGIVVFL